MAALSPIITSLLAEHWISGLLVFYEIFKFLEEALERHKDSLIGDLLIPGMARTAAFEVVNRFSPSVILTVNWTRSD